MPSIIDKVNKNQIHVVLLGAGASKASMPNGDKNRKLIPLMNELNSIDAVSNVMVEHGLNIENKTFEELYSDLALNHPDEPAIEQLNDSIYDYFKDLQLPDRTTIYDYLILSLKENDVIATFNWDPFLVQAYIRVQKITTKLPQLFFLHGTVALGRCKEHLIVDLIGNNCPRCNKKLERIRLLYPTTSKDYTSDDYIKEQWDGLKFYLSKANGMTVFGYASPKTDVAAIELLKEGWGGKNKRVMEEIDIINIDDPKKLKDSWHEFIYESHYTIFSDYFESSIARFPRRVSEYQFCRFNLNMWLDDHKFDKNLEFAELEERISKLIKFESS